ncbi:MAG: hypothetical protein JSV22_07285 [Bacteroidales bacterium]|nr:MAG: hypothetical protein JSV22_07285 [Bacteroidales bacterium]
MNKKLYMIIRILIIKTFLIAILTLHALVISHGQDAIDVLLNERVVDRPVSLHKGQLQINSFYLFDLFTKSYDNNSVKSNLRDQGTASAMHNYLFNLNYGILEHIQFTIGMNYTSTTRRTHDKYYIISDDNYIKENEITEIKGFEDIFIGSLVRLPFNINFFDIGISLGVNLPTAKYRADRPEHKIESIPGYTNSFSINYHNIYPAGKGVPAILFGLQGKFRTSRMAVNLYSDYLMSGKEATNIYWQYRVENSSFHYQSEEYIYMPDNLFSLAINIDYQAFPWFDIFGGFYLENTFGGWNEKYGPRISNYETGLNFVFIGFEIQATPHVRFYQKAGQTISGKNTIGPVSFQTGISYNLFPFKNK